MQSWSRGGPKFDYPGKGMDALILILNFLRKPWDESWPLGESILRLNSTSSMEIINITNKIQGF